MPPKKRRCKWFNDEGHPRINPFKLKRGDSNPTGCHVSSSSQCFFVHPSSRDWDFAAPTHPKYFEYPDNRIPRTPTPPPRSRTRSTSRSRSSSRSRSRSRTPQPYNRKGRDSSTIPKPGASSDPWRIWSTSKDPDTDSKLRGWGKPPSSPLPPRPPEPPSDPDLDQNKDPKVLDYPPDSDDLPKEPRGGRDGGFKSALFRDQSPRKDIPLLNRISPSIQLCTKWTPISTQHASQSTPAAQPPLPLPLQQIVASPSIPSSTNSFSQAGNIFLKPDSSMPPPPTPVSTTTTVFQHSVPPLPSFLQSHETLQKDPPLSREEREKVWDERIELLKDAIVAQRAHSQRIANLKQLESLASPERTAQLPAAVREQITASLQNAQAQVDAARARTVAFHQKIQEVDFWPVRRVPKANDDTIKKEEEGEVIEDAHTDIKERVAEFANNVFGIDRQMKEVTQFLISSRARSVAVSSSSAVVPMDWESSDTARGAKRRKVGEDGSYASDSGSTTVERASPVPSATVAASTSIDAFLQARRIAHRVTKLESSFHDLDNLYAQAEAQASDELAVLVDVQVERLRRDLARTVKGRCSEYDETIKKQEEELDRMGKEMEIVVDEVAGLVSAEAKMSGMVKSVIEERERLEGERTEIRAAIEQNTALTSNMQAQIAANVEETNSLRHSLSLLQNTPSSLSTPPPQHTPTLDELSITLLPRILDAVRDDLQPRLQSQKSDVIQLVRENYSAAASPINELREKVERVEQLPEMLGILRASGMLNGNLAAHVSINGNIGTESNDMAEVVPVKVSTNGLSSIRP